MQNQGLSELPYACKRTPHTVSPIIRVNLKTDYKAMSVNEMSTSKISGLSQEESNAVLKFLFAHTTQPEFTYRHTWRVGDLLMWDNESTQHLALSDYDIDVPRIMYRTTLLGVPSGRLAEASDWE